MPALNPLSRAFLALAFAMLAVSLYKALLSATRGRGLLSGTVDGQPEPERGALVATTVGVLATYAATCLHNAASGHFVLPSPDASAFWVLGGSHGCYLIGKAYRQR